MSKNTLPVIAAIPNYNDAEKLNLLLPQALDQEYDEVCVMDDASSDHSQEVVSQYSEVVFIAGEQNLGAGGNRNRILKRYAGKNTLLHFIDADVSLVSENNPEIIRDIMSHPSNFFVGGLITDQDAKPSCWNYGPRQSIGSDITGLVQVVVEQAVHKDYERAQRLFGHLYKRFIKDWPNPFVEPEEKTVFFCSEPNLAIKSGVFEAVGGFDIRLRYHEVMDLAMKLDNIGVTRKFNPSFSVTTQYDITPGRVKDMLKAEFQIQTRHGWLNWFKPGIMPDPTKPR